MKPNNLYAQLELITTDFEHPTPAKSSKSSGFNKVWAGPKACLGQIGQSLLHYFCGSMDPRILTKRDRQGNDYFVVHDSCSQEHHTFSSEAELRVWLDKRYYQ